MEINSNQEQDSFIIDSNSPNNEWITVFEDNGETGYMYLCSCTETGDFDKIIDHLWIYNKINPPIDKCKEVFIIWSGDSKKSGLIVDGECWGIFDLSTKRKINAPRDNGKIISIERHVWDDGINESEGEPLK